jgi:hypothetical protein
VVRFGEADCQHYQQPDSIGALALSEYGSSDLNNNAAEMTE